MGTITLEFNFRSSQAALSTTYTFELGGSHFLDEVRAFQDDYLDELIRDNGADWSALDFTVEGWSVLDANPFDFDDLDAYSIHVCEVNEKHHRCVRSYA